MGGREVEISFILWFTSPMATTGRAGPVESQKPGFLQVFHTMAGAQVRGSSPAAFLSTLAGKWIESGAAGT